MKNFFRKLLSLLRVRTTAAGIEVNDQVVRLVYFDKGVWQMHAMRLAPGVVEEGKIKDHDTFVTALKELKAKVEQRGKKKVNVVLCMSSVAAYTQMFSLPAVTGENLEKAVELNLQMASPLEPGAAYYGWQIVEREKSTATMRLLSVFTERTVVDAMVATLFEAGFLVMAVESRALSLTRLLREKGAGVDIGKSYIFVSIDNAGIDFLIIRNGALHFEYATSWRELMNEKGDISVEKFEEAFKASIRQVMNFYNQHWSEPLGTIILSAVALAPEAQKVLAETATVPSAELTLVMGQPISSEWLTALGCSLRGAGGNVEHEISLLGEDSEDRFHEEQLISFMRFWRVAVPVAFCFLIAAFIAVDIFLVDTKNQIESRADLNVNGAQVTAITSLQAEASDFNTAVTLVNAAENETSPKGVFLSAIITLASANGISLDHMSFQSFTTPISMSGSATSEDAVTAFKTALTKDPAVSGVDLPLTGIQTNAGVTSFSVSFTYTPPSP